MSIAGVALVLSWAAVPAGGAPPDRDGETVEAIAATNGHALRPERVARHRLVVTKSRYRLDVYEGEKLVRVFPVALGGEPVGRKERQGDHRTPEGAYVLIPHHASPGFGECFYVCYPSGDDARSGVARGLIDRGTAAAIDGALARAARPPHGTALGGLILLHGTRDRAVVGLTEINWTDGCIAMENDHLIELLAAFSPRDRPVLEIVP